MDLKIASYNIHKGTLGLGRFKRLRIHELAEGIAALDADLVFLQEVQGAHRKHAAQIKAWPDAPQAQFLAAAAKLHHAYIPNAHTRHGEHGNALLSRFAIKRVVREEMSDHAFEQRGLLHVELEGGLHCIVLHLGLIGASRKRQIAITQRYIAREIPADAPLIVAGDFNDWRNHVEPEQLGAGFQNALSGPTLSFPARLPLLALDRIYVRGLQVKPQVIPLPRHVDWRDLSDHAPVLARVAWNRAV